MVCAFLKKKYTHLDVAPEPLAIWNKKLEVALIFRRRALEHIPGFFIKKNSDIARFGFFLS